jgi:hypothetical protein
MFLRDKKFATNVVASDLQRAKSSSVYHDGDGSDADEPSWSLGLIITLDEISSIKSSSRNDTLRVTFAGETVASSSQADIITIILQKAINDVSVVVL